MTIRRGKLLVSGSALLAVGVIAWFFRPPPVRVDIAVLQTGPLCVTIDEEGMTRVRERYVVAAPVAGRMQRLELEPGDAVAAGRTVIATFRASVPPLLDTRTRAETDAKVKAAEATRDHARVLLRRAIDEATFSRGELERQGQIAKFGGVTEERLAAAELDARTKDVLVKAAEAMLQRAEHELDAARAALQQVVSAPSAAAGALALRSPVSGVVLRVLQQSEAPVPAGAPLVEIGDPRQLEIVTDLLSNDAIQVQPGFRAQIVAWGGSAPLPGRVRLVEPAGFTKISALGVEEQRVNVLIDLDVLHGEARKLGDGFRVETRIITSERADVLKAPTSALFRVGEAWAVFAVRDGRAAQTTVQVGLRNAIEAEVLSGLAAGDQVVIHPGDTIAQGVRVTPR